MKVLYLAPEGGAGRLTAMSFIDEELVALQRRGIEAHVVAPDLTHDEVVSGIRKRAVRAIAGRPAALRLAATWLRRVPPRSAWAEAARLLYVLRAEAAALVLARAERFDLIHSHFAAFGGIGGLLAAERSGTPLVATFRGMDLNCDPTFEYGLRQSPLFDANVRQLLAGATRTLYVSEDMRRTGIALGARPERAHTVLKGVDLDRFVPRSDGEVAKARLGLEGFVILTVASLLPKKGIDIALRALALLTPSHPLTYVVCGDGRERGRLEALARELGVAHLVRFAGRVSRSEVTEYFAASDLFVMTSLNEGSGNVYLEAQASGKPCIASTCGGPPEYVRDGVTGFTVTYGDAGQLAARIRTLYEDRQLSLRMGTAARAWMEGGFHYRRMEDDILHAYELATGEAARDPAEQQAFSMGA